MKAAKLFFILLCLAALIAPAAAAGGAGTAANPYVIQTPAELQSIQNNLAAYYVLGNDIDLSGVTWTPIGSPSSPFSGQLDGNGYTIKNLALSSTAQNAGLFRVLTSGATIKDLLLEDCHVESTASRCGTLVGSIIMSESAHETATLQNIELLRCSATSASSQVANIVSLIYTAAVVDIIDCTVSQCVAESTASNSVANIVGYCSGASSTHIVGATVEYSHAKAVTNSVANIVGYCASASSLIVEESEVNTCIAESTARHNVANIVGSCHSASFASVEDTRVINSIAKAATNYAGGIFGVVWDSGSGISASGCVVQDCTLVATESYAGGIAGRVTPGTTGVFSSNTITGCTILATSYAATICPAFS